MGNIDVSNYQSWPKIVGPSGGVYYKVPNSSYVYDPFQSQAAGRSVFHPDPTQAWADQKTAKDEHNAAIEAQANANNPFRQIGLAGVGATLPVAVGKIANSYWPSAIDKQALAKIPVSQGGTLPDVNTAITQQVTPLQTTATQATQAAQTAAGNAGDGAGQGAQVGTIPGSTDVVTPISSQTGDAFVNSALGGAGGGAEGGAVGSEAANAAGALDTSSAATTDLGAATNAASGIADAGGVLGTGLGILPLAGVGAGLGLLGNGIYNMLSGKKDNSALGIGSRATLGVATGGISEIANALGLFDHTTTKQDEAKRWGDLATQGITGAADAFKTSQNLGAASGQLTQGPDAGKPWNFEEAQKYATQNPADFSQVYGNFATFGNDWAKYSPDQQNQITKALIDNKLYYSKQGDVLISDADKARQIKDQILGGTYQAPDTTPPPTAPHVGAANGVGVSQAQVPTANGVATVPSQQITQAKYGAQVTPQAMTPQQMGEEIAKRMNQRNA